MTMTPDIKEQPNYQSTYGAVPPSSNYENGVHANGSVSSKTCRGLRYWGEKALLVLLGLVVGLAVVSGAGRRSYVFDDEQQPQSVQANATPQVQATVTSPPTTPVAPSQEVDKYGEEETVEEIEARIRAKSELTKLKHAGVATDDERCSALGNHIIQDLNGNAVDAAVASTLCLGIVNPAGSTIGGGAFMLIHADLTENDSPAYPDYVDKRAFNDDAERRQKGDKSTIVIDCREIAPEKAHIGMFDDKPSDATWTGPLAMAVPGQLHCLQLAHARYGKVAWKDLVMPAATMAREGVVVTPYLGHAINLRSSKKKIFDHTTLRDMFTRDHAGETLLQDGDIMTFPKLADTLEAVAEQGLSAFYQGERAKAVAKEIQDLGGILTETDLNSFRATIRDPLITKPGEVKGFTMVGIPPPSSGGCIVIGAARLLSNYPEAFGVFADDLSQHRTVEAMKHAYAIRMSLSDPAFFSNVTEAAVRDLMTGDFMEKLRQTIKDDDVLPLHMYGGETWGILKDDDALSGAATVTAEGHDNRRLRQRPHAQQRRNLKDFQYLNDHGTTHIAIIDGSGNAVTMTTTINTYFGSGIASPSTGVIFNSQMDDFASPGKPNHYGVEPSPSNYIVPGKKPLSSMSPTLIFRPSGVFTEDGVANLDSRDLNSQRLVMAFGASGGPKIPTATLQAFLNFFFYGMPLYDAIRRPRLHDQLIYKNHVTTLYDNDHIINGPDVHVSDLTKDALKARKHALAPVPNTGCVQAVAIDLETGLLTAVSDPRKGGSPAGF